jgi:ligand-binding sensor domain-containing protein
MLACLALAAAGCAARGPRPPANVPEGELLEALAAPQLSPAELRAFRDIPERVIPAGDRTWVIQPRSVVALKGNLVEARFGEAEGLLGSILSASMGPDSTTLSLGTTGGVNQIDLQFLTMTSYGGPGDTTDTYARYISVDDRRDLWVVTRQAVVWLNPGSRTWRNFPFRDFTYADLREVLFDGPYIWLATQQGLRRFSAEWKAWDPVPGSRELAKSGILHLERDRGRRLWAMSDRGLYFYDRQFDTWRFVNR